MNHLLAMASYEVEDTERFPKAVFSKIIKSNMGPLKYWMYTSRITTSSEGKQFAEMMAKIFSLPPSSAGMERIFSTAGLVQSKLRDRLGIEKVGRLVNVSRILSASSGQDGVTGLEEYELKRKN